VTTDAASIQQDELWDRHGVRLGLTRRAVTPPPADLRPLRDLEPAERIRLWFHAHGTDGKIRRGQKPGEAVYAARMWSNPRFIKIGRSGRTGARFDIIRTSNPFFIEMLMDALVKDAGQAEVALQAAFAEHCVCGEWFHFPEATETEVVEALKACTLPPTTFEGFQ
jgi:hypothetical protein